MHKNKPVNFAPAKQQKMRKRTRFQAKTAEAGCDFGCWRGWEQLKTGKTRCEKPKFEPKRTPFPCNTGKKKTGRNPEFPPVLWQGQKDLVSAAASVGPGRSPPGCRPPRHAPQAGLRAQPVAKSFRTLTKKPGTAKAIPDYFGSGKRAGPAMTM